MTTNQASDNIKNGKSSLSRVIFLIPIFTATITAFAMSAFFLITEFNEYEVEKKAIKSTFIEDQKLKLKYRILSAKDYIHFVRTHSDQYINSYVNRKTAQVNDILSTGVGSVEDKENLFTPLAFDSLQQMFLHSSIQIAITDSSGQCLLTSQANDLSKPVNPSIWQRIQECKKSGRFFPGENGWLALLESGKQGDAVLTSINKDHQFHLYLLLNSSDTTLMKKELCLDSLSKIRYENGEYIFINTYDGKGLITKGILYRSPLDIITGRDTNWINIFQKELEFANKAGGDFLTYNWQKDSITGLTEKISYISGIEDWKWIIGTGMHTNDIEPLLQDKRDILKKSIEYDLIAFIIFLTLFLIILYFITRYFSNLTTSNIRLFVRFLKNAAISLQPLDETKVNFKEFQTLAKAANHMISERNRIKSDLINEQSRLKYIIDSIPDLIFFKDNDSLFVGCNHAFEKYIGKKASEIRGASEFDLFPKAMAEGYIETDKRLLKSLEPVRSTDWIIYPDGRKILCDTLKTLYFDDEGNVLGIIGISRDITEMEETRQRLIMAKEKAEESDRLKTAFLANMSHEIRTPMNAIIGFSDLLSDEELSREEREDFISKIKLSGESLMNIINDIIDIAKIEAGQLKITDADCNVDKLLSDIYGTFFELKNKSHKNEIELKLTFPKLDGPLMTIIDPLRLQQVLTNLLSNALKFTEFGEIEFGYTIKNSIIHFFVRDTGIGILRSKQPLLFQRFSQVDTSNTRKYGGTGLGLAISRNIIELMGGTIWLESEPGQGSTFHFTIPHRPVHHSEDVHSSENSYNWKQKTILIAEDIDQNYLLMEAILRFTQVNLLHAPNGQDAIDMVKANPGINLVLMDIQLPVKTGYEAIHEILQLVPDMPIISFTAFALPREREKSLEAGCVEFMNKPIKPDLLLKIVQKHMR